MPIKVVVNKSSYAPIGKPTPYRRMTLVVDAVLDSVPGTFHKEDDLMNEIARNPYVRKVTLIGEPTYTPMDQQTDEMNYHEVEIISTHGKAKIQGTMIYVLAHLNEWDKNLGDIESIIADSSIVKFMSDAHQALVVKNN